MDWSGSRPKLRTAHESVGWLGDGPGGVVTITECDNPNCNCHEAVKEAKEKNEHFSHRTVSVRYSADS